MGISRWTIIFDEFSNDFFSIVAYYDGNNIYVITTQANGEIEFVWTQFNEPVHVTRLSIDVLDVQPQENILHLANNKEFMNSVKAYSFNNLNLSRTITPPQSKVNSVPSCADATTDAFMERLIQMHGDEHTFYDWTRLGILREDGLRYEFLENKSIDVVCVDTVSFDTTMTLGSLFALILSTIPQLYVTMIILSEALNVANATYTYLLSSGVIAGYTAVVVYDRFVLINDGGPYVTSKHRIEYDGWANTADLDRLQLVETSDTYNPMNEDLFENYQTQKQWAYENYMN